AVKTEEYGYVGKSASSRCTMRLANQPIARLTGHASKALPHGGAGIGFFQQCHDILDGRGLPQEASERFLTQVAENRLHGIQMICRPIFRAEQKKDGVDRLLVNRVEVDAGAAEAHSHRHLADGRVLDVRYRDDVAKAG